MLCMFFCLAVAVAAPVVFGIIDIDGISSTAKTWIIVGERGGGGDVKYIFSSIVYLTRYYLCVVAPGWVVFFLLAFPPTRIFLKAANKVMPLYALHQSVNAWPPQSPTSTHQKL